MPSAVERDNAARIATVFRRYDTDSSGTMDSSELVPALCELGVDVSDTARVAAMMAEVDADGSGQLDLPEFSQIFAVNRLRGVFDDIDADRSGSNFPRPPHPRNDFQGYRTEMPRTACVFQPSPPTSSV